MRIGKEIKYEDLLLGNEYLVTSSEESTYPDSYIWEHDRYTGKHIFRNVIDRRVYIEYDNDFIMYEIMR